MFIRLIFLFSIETKKKSLALTCNKYLTVYLYNKFSFARDNIRIEKIRTYYVYVVKFVCDKVYPALKVPHFECGYVCKVYSQ